MPRRSRPQLVTSSAFGEFYDDVNLELEKIRTLAKHILQHSKEGDAGVLAELITDCADRVDTLLEDWATQPQGRRVAPGA
jgi:hypothetical protein